MTRPPTWTRLFAWLALAVLCLPIVGVLAAIAGALPGYHWWQWSTSP